MVKIISSRKLQSGFSLIELVAVILIMGVLAVATTQYITFGTEVYVQSSERQKVLSQSRFLVERLTREIRIAIPNSVRIRNSGTQSCIEFVPIKTSGAYRVDSNAALPPISPNSADDSIDVISWDAMNNIENDRIYIYATKPSDIYDPTNDIGDKFGRILSVAVTSGQSAPEYTITLKDEITDTSASSESFPEESPITRYFTADHSISYCLIFNSSTSRYDVYRFVFTDFSVNQNLPSASAGVLMAEGLTNDLSVANTNTRRPFDYTDASQTRNSIVNLYLEFEANQSENMFYNHEVHIPNVP